MLCSSARFLTQKTLFSPPKSFILAFKNTLSSSLQNPSISRPISSRVLHSCIKYKPSSSKIPLFASIRSDHSMASQSTTAQSIHDFTVKDAKGNDVELSKYKGKVLIIVNVASQCGLTNSNYTELAQLYEKYKNQGLEILAFPCNQFGAQEPGSNEEIVEFACTRFKAEYPIFDKFLNQLGSPKNGKRSVGKENKGQLNGVARWDSSPKRVLKQSNVLENSRKNSPSIRLPVKCDMSKLDLGGVSFRRRSLSPLFDPENGEEKTKKMVTESATSWKARNLEDSESILQVFEKICPPGGENAVVIYTTTLRGIRKTFEDCNIVRSIIESHHVQMFERDVSMDSGFKAELRGLMETKQVKVPVKII